MPLYDCVLMLKPHVEKKALVELVSRVSKHVYARNGVLTEIKSFGTVNLGYGIRKLDGRYFQGRLLQITMMATPNINKELHYLNKEDRLLRWLLVKHRNTKFGLDYIDDSGESKGELNKLLSSSFLAEPNVDKEEDDDDDDEYDELNKEDS